MVVSYASVRLTRSATPALEELAVLLQGGASRPPDLESRLTLLVQELLAQREAARKARAWATADGIRQALTAHGFRLEDDNAATHAVLEVAAHLKLPAIAVTLVKE